MRVLHLLTSPLIGGTERMVLRLLEFGQTADVRHELAILQGEGPVADRARALGARVHGLAGAAGRLGGAKARRAIGHLVRGEPIEVVHLYGLRADLAGRAPAARAGAAVVSAIRSTDPWRRWYHTALDRLTAHHVDLWISNSEAGKRATMARERVAAERIRVVCSGVEWPPPVDSAERAARRRAWAAVGLLEAGEPLIFLCLANLRSMKGHDSLVDAFAKVARERAEALLVLAGRDGEAAAPLHHRSAELLQRAAAQGCGRRVIYVGAGAEPAALLAASDVAVLASEHEGLPASLIEAMAAGRPVVSTNIGGVPELIDDGEEGVLVPVGDVGRLADAMGLLADDCGRREAMGEAARARWEREFTVSRMCSMLNAIYQELGEKRHSR